MRALRQDDEGAVAVIVALLAVVIFGFGALVIDAGMLYAERRDLQSGADAASLSIAGECAENTCTGPAARTAASSLADGNVADDTADVPLICSNHEPLVDGTNVTSCAPPDGLPAGVKFVKVETATRNPASLDPSKVDPALSRLLGNEGVPVASQSVAVWGGSTSLPGTLPLTFSYCEWAILTNGGQDLLEWPATTDEMRVSELERKIVIFGGDDDPELHHCSEIAADTELPVEPSLDTPGGFAWLSGAKDGCTSSIPQDDGTYEASAGNSSGDCPALLRSLWEATWVTETPQLIYLPVYGSVDGHDYTIMSSMAFVLTGFHLSTGCGKPGDCKRPSQVSNSEHPAGEYCNERNWDTNVLKTNNNQNCLTGFFVEAPPPAPAPVGGPSLGVTVFNLFS